MLSCDCNFVIWFCASVIWACDCDCNFVIWSCVSFILACASCRLVRISACIRAIKDCASVQPSGVGRTSGSSPLLSLLTPTAIVALLEVPTWISTYVSYWCFGGCRWLSVVPTSREKYTTSTTVPPPLHTTATPTTHNSAYGAIQNICTKQDLLKTILHTCPFSPLPWSTYFHEQFNMAISAPGRVPSHQTPPSQFTNLQQRPCSNAKTGKHTIDQDHCWPTYYSHITLNFSPSQKPHNKGAHIFFAIVLPVTALKYLAQITQASS